MSVRNPAIFASVAVAALVGGAGVAYAVTQHPGATQTTSLTTGSTPTPSSSPTPSAAPTPGKHRGFGFGGFGGFGIGGYGGAVHGQLTVPKSGGGYQTVDVQRGTVTAVSSSSITVKSADGFTATYTVTGSTEVNAESAGIGSVKSADSVFVTATVSGGTATASNITDMTSIGASRGAFGFPGRSGKVGS